MQVNSNTTSFGMALFISPKVRKLGNEGVQALTEAVPGLKKLADDTDIYVKTTGYSNHNSNDAIYLILRPLRKTGLGRLMQRGLQGNTVHSESIPIAFGRAGAEAVLAVAERAKATFLKRTRDLDMVMSQLRSRLG